MANPTCETREESIRLIMLSFYLINIIVQLLHPYSSFQLVQLNDRSKNIFKVT